MRNKLITWLGMTLAILCILLISRKDIGVAMFAGAIILGLLSAPGNLATILWSTITDPATVLLMAVIGLIPIIGSILMTSGQMDRFIVGLGGKRSDGFVNDGSQVAKFHVHIDTSFNFPHV